MSAKKETERNKWHDFLTINVSLKEHTKVCNLMNFETHIIVEVPCKMFLHSLQMDECHRGKWQQQRDTHTQKQQHPNATQMEQLQMAFTFAIVLLWNGWMLGSGMNFSLSVCVSVSLAGRVYAIVGAHISNQKSFKFHYSVFKLCVPYLMQWLHVCQRMRHTFKRLIKKEIKLGSVCMWMCVLQWVRVCFAPDKHFCLLNRWWWQQKQRRLPSLLTKRLLK